MKRQKSEAYDKALEGIMKAGVERIINAFVGQAEEKKKERDGEETESDREEDEEEEEEEEQVAPTNPPAETVDLTTAVDSLTLEDVGPLPPLNPDERRAKILERVWIWGRSWPDSCLSVKLDTIEGDPSIFAQVAGWLLARGSSVNVFYDEDIPPPTPDVLRKIYEAVFHEFRLYNDKETRHKAFIRIATRRTISAFNRFLIEYILPFMRDDKKASDAADEVLGHVLGTSYTAEIRKKQMTRMRQTLAICEDHHENRDQILKCFVEPILLERLPDVFTKVFRENQHLPAITREGIHPMVHSICSTLFPTGHAIYSMPPFETIMKHLSDALKGVFKTLGSREHRSGLEFWPADRSNRSSGDFASTRQLCMRVLRRLADYTHPRPWDVFVSSDGYFSRQTWIIGCTRVADWTPVELKPGIGVHFESKDNELIETQIKWVDSWHRMVQLANDEFMFYSDLTFSGLWVNGVYYRLDIPEGRPLNFTANYAKLSNTKASIAGASEKLAVRIQEEISDLVEEYPGYRSMIIGQTMRVVLPRNDAIKLIVFRCQGVMTGMDTRNVYSVGSKYATLVSPSAVFKRLTQLLDAYTKIPWGVIGNYARNETGLRTGANLVQDLLKALYKFAHQHVHRIPVAIEGTRGVTKALSDVMRQVGPLAPHQVLLVECSEIKVDIARNHRFRAIQAGSRGYGIDSIDWRNLLAYLGRDVTTKEIGYNSDYEPFETSV